MSIDAGGKVAAQLIEALGVDSKLVRRFVLSASPGEVTTLSVEMYPDCDALRRGEIVMRKYDLVPKDG